MKENLRLLSIVIATRNRQKYALSAIAGILKNSDSRLELVVQDNSDDRSLQEALKIYSDDCRLIYRYAELPLSAVDNFNAAIELSSGEYVCLIGDDDGIWSEILVAVAWAKENGIDALVGSLSANYRWAGTGAPDTFFTKMSDSTLTMTHFTGKVRKVDVENSLIRFSSSGLTYYLDFDLPKLYHGIVKKDLLERLYDLNGAYIKALSPDIYLSLCLATVVRNLVVVDFPLTLPGVCPGSGSVVEGQIKRHSRRLEDAPHFRNWSGYAWSSEVPPIYCVEAIWADSAIHALRDMNREDLLKSFNKYRMYANIMNANLDTRSTCTEHMIRQSNDLLGKKVVLLVYAFIAGPLMRFIYRRAISRLLIILELRRLREIREVPDIDSAMSALSQYLSEIAAELPNPSFFRIPLNSEYNHLRVFSKPK